MFNLTMTRSQLQEEPMVTPQLMKVRGIAIPYTLFETVRVPDDNLGLVGDICKADDNYYVKKASGWSLGELEHTLHPVHQDGGLLSISRGKAMWATKSILRSRAYEAKMSRSKRKRQKELDGTDGEVEGESLSRSKR